MEVPDYWDALSADFIREADNGCGLASWPERLRKLIDLYSGFKPPAAVHDVEWAMAERVVQFGDRESLLRYEELIHESNRRFRRNCMTVTIGVSTPLWRHPLKRFRRWRVACRFYRYVQIGGAASILAMRRNYQRHQGREA
jgi:hypothetical protein